MKNHKAAVLLIFAVILSFAFALYYFYGSMAVSIFSRSNNLSISYKSLNVQSLSKFRFKDLEVIVRGTKNGFFAEEADADVITRSNNIKGLYLNLRNLRIIGMGKDSESALKNLDDLIAAPFSDFFVYKSVTAEVFPIDNGVEVKELTASGDLVRFSFGGSITYDSFIDADISIFFERSLTGKIPAELAGMALTDREDGWQSLDIKLEGDFSKPALKVTGRLFRLNIGIAS